MVRIRGRIGDWPVDLTLELDAEASCVIGKLCLRLDTRLGLVFEATELTIQPEGKE